MKMKLMAAALIMFLASCNYMTTNSGMGIFYAEVTEPVMYANGVAHSKTGEACQESFFSLISIGDSSVEKAKQNGGIVKVGSVNLTKKNVAVYGRTCTVVKGE